MTASRDGSLVGRDARRVRRGATLGRIGEKLPRWIAAACGIPAAAGLIALVLLFRRTSSFERNLAVEYSTAAANAEAAGDLEAAVLAHRRLVQVGGAQDEFVFGLASALARAGNPEQAEALVRRITRLDKRGYAPARIWLANRLITDPLPTAEGLDDAERQLTLVLKDDPHSADAQSLLCRLCLDSGRLSEAELHLADSALEDRFDLKLRLARAFWSIGDRRHAADYARRVEAFYSQRVYRHPEEPTSRLYLAEAQTLGANDRGAVATLQAGLDLKQGDLSLLWGALGGAYLAWADGMPERTPEERQARVDRLKECLTALASGPPGDLEIDRQKAQAYIKLRRLAEAEPPLRRAAEKFPGLLLEWARLHAYLGNGPKAFEIGEDARRRFQQALERAPRSEPLRTLAADAEFFLGRHASALETLKAGMTTGNDAVLRRAAARVLVNWSEVVERRTPDDSGRMVELTVQALEMERWNAAAVQRLEVIRTRPPNGDAAAARALDKLLADDDPPVTVLAALGARATLRGELDRARTLLERAYRTGTPRTDVASNLAWVLAHQEKPDLQRALEIATRAMLPLSEPPATLRSTRGEIYAKLEQWADARRDLEAALPALAGQGDFHALLAQVYDELGETDRAKEQRRLAR